MLSNQDLELLTAAVDGELDDRQQHRLERLLRQSPTARHVLEQLQSDSRQLTALPRMLPPRELPRQVLREAAHVPAPVPATPSTLAPAAGLPGWLALTIAASVLVVITAASYWFFSRASRHADDPPPIAHEEPPSDDAKSPRDDLPRGIKDPEPPKKFERPPAQKGSRSFTYALADIELRLLKDAASGLRHLPHLYTLGDLPARPEVRKRLAADLGRWPGVEVDVITTSGSKTAKQLQEVFAKKGIKLLVDAQTDKRMKQGDRAGFLLFVEDLPPWQVAGLLEELGRLQKPTPTVQMAALGPLSANRRAELAKALGLKPAQMKPARHTGKKVDLPPDTPAQIVVTTGVNPKGEKTGTPKDQPPTPQRLALLLAFDSSGKMPSATPEIMQFRKSRGATRPDNTLQLVVVLHERPA